MKRMRCFLFALCCTFALGAATGGPVPLAAVPIIQCTHGCKEIKIGRVLCVNCCTCCVVDGVNDCECSTGCADF